MNMKLSIFFVEYNQIQQFNELIPTSQRSKLVREFIKNHTNLIDFSHVVEVGQETISFHLDSAVNKKIDLLAAEHNLNRSEIMRVILNAMIEFYTSHPVEMKKTLKRTFTVPEGTMEHLKALIAFGERDGIIEEFILNLYDGPNDKSVNVLKARAKATETMMVSLTEEALNKLEGIAAGIGNKVKRSHIFKDCIEQLIASKQIEQMQRAKLENELTDTLSQLKQVTSKSEIKAVINKVL